MADEQLAELRALMSDMPPSVRRDIQYGTGVADNVRTGNVQPFRRQDLVEALDYASLIPTGLGDVADIASFGVSALEPGFIRRALTPPEISYNPDFGMQNGRYQPPFSFNPSEENWRLASLLPLIAGPIAFRGTVRGVDSLDPNVRGYSTGARSAQDATWFTSDPRTAKTYAVYAAEDAPIREALNQADSYERLAQRTGDQSWWDKYDEAMRIAEELDTRDARFSRRGSMATVETVDIPDDLDLLVIDAQGKTPWELAGENDVDSWLSEQIQKAKRQGKSGVRFDNLDDAINLSDRPATHYAIFDPSVVKILGSE